MEQLPVFHTGCDSSYSWAKKFSHLAGQSTAGEISQKVRAYLEGGQFQHPRSRQHTHLALTGGEPMMSQTAIVDVLQHMRDVDHDLPRFVTIETNGTQMPRQPFVDFMYDVPEQHMELFWSVSPKLYLSGEPWAKAIRPEVLRQYEGISNRGQLKYVCDGTQRAWDEVERATDAFRNEGISWPVWIMPVGADREMQESHQAPIAEEACKRGYNVAARVHTWVFGNVIGK
jgi:organic radical activating enzyme